MDFDVGVGTPVLNIDDWDPQCGTDDARARVSRGSVTTRALTTASTAEVHEKALAHRAATDCSNFPLLASHKELGRLGVGVRLYFTFLMHMGVLFTIATLFVAASISFNSMGSMVDDSHWLGLISKTSVGNLGNCPAGRCRSFQDIQDRCAYDIEGGSCLLRVRDVAQLLGILDCMPVLVFAGWALWFTYWRIQEIVDDTDKRNTTPADYTIKVSSLQRRLGEDHARYAEKLREHFVEVLEACAEGAGRPSGAEEAPRNEQPIVEVVLARDYCGAITELTAAGKLQRQRDNAQALVERAERKSSGEVVVRQRLKETNILGLKLESMKEKLRPKAATPDEHRHVCSAFVTFRREEYKCRVLHAYRFVRHWHTRRFQPPHLRFEGRPIRVSEACEPSDIVWENLEHGSTTCRRLRSFLLTSLILVAAVRIVAALKSPQRAPSMPRASSTWVMAAAPGSGSDELELCGWQLFSSASCSADAPSSTTWTAARVFNSAGAVPVPGLPSGGGCAGAVRSAPASSWVGVEFGSEESVRCMAVRQSQSAAARELRIYACASAPSEPTALAAWDLSSHCQAIEAVHPKAGEVSSLLRLEPGTSCAADISVEVAEQARARAADPAVDALLNCFCEQLPFSEVRTHRLCQEWRENTASVYGSMIASAAVLCVLNLAWQALSSRISRWERLQTLTDVMASELWKLFLFQFVTTGLLVVLINADFRTNKNTSSVAEFFQVGVGEYHDLDPQWVTMVGSTLVLTMIFSVFSSTVLPPFQSFCCQEANALWKRRTVATQETMDEIYMRPSWTLSQRLAETLTVIFCIMMYSAPLPILYPIGMVYCFAAYWFDRVCLLRLSSLPPQYTQHVQQKTMRLLPCAVLLHVLVAGWTFGNQRLFPSDWSFLLPLAERIFGIDSAMQDRVMGSYRSGEAQGVTWELISARLLSFARRGAWPNMCLVALCAGFCIAQLIGVWLQPLLDPALIWAAELCPWASSCLTSARHQSEEPHAYEEAVEWWRNERRRITTSYDLFSNDMYREATQTMRELSTSSAAGIGACSAQNNRRPS